jgi:hypothetical protein
MLRHDRGELAERRRGRVPLVWLAGIVLTLACSLPGAAHAFSDPQAYADPVDLGGGAGRWFTGSSADGFGCNVCHTGKAGENLLISGLPVDGYVPGRGYEVTLTWPPYVLDVALIAEFTNEQRLGVGALALPRPETLKPTERCAADQGGESPASLQEADGMRQLVSVVDCGAKLVRFQWTAPLAAAGPVWFNAGFVASNQDATPNGDGVTLVSRHLSIAGTPPETQQVAQGCAVVTRTGSRQPLVIVLLLALASAHRARRREEYEP